MSTTDLIERLRNQLEELYRDEVASLRTENMALRKALMKAETEAICWKALHESEYPETARKFTIVTDDQGTRAVLK